VNADLLAFIERKEARRAAYRDGATASLLENWIDEVDRRSWLLFEATRAGEAG
jgi:starvation-inducible DNA-binding protein